MDKNDVIEDHLQEIEQRYFYSLLGLTEGGTNDPDYIFEVARSIPYLIYQVRRLQRDLEFVNHHYVAPQMKAMTGEGPTIAEYDHD